MNFSKRCLDISKSITLAISAKAKQMQSEGLDVVGFGAGQPDFDTPDYIVAAAKEALDKGFTNYTPASGTNGLKEAICNKFARDNQLNYNPEQIIVSNGAKHSLFNTFQAILNPGDEVIITAPYWVSYPELIKLGGGIPVVVDTMDNNFKITAAGFANAISSKTKAFILNSPSNPNGAVYSRKELESIAKVAVENQILIIADEIYEYLIYDDREHISIASLNQEVKDLTIVINGMSKAYAMTGWRIGFAAANQDIVDIMSNVQSHSTSNPNSIAQYASTVGLNETKKANKAINLMVLEFKRRRDYMTKRINQIEGLACNVPQGAFYLMMDISQIIGKSYRGKLISGSLSFADQLLETAEVAVVPGVAFGADEYVRLSYANSMDNIKKGLERIEDFVSQLT